MTARQLRPLVRRVQAAALQAAPLAALLAALLAAPLAAPWQAFISRLATRAMPKDCFVRVCVHRYGRLSHDG